MTDPYMGQRPSWRESRSSGIVSQVECPSWVGTCPSEGATSVEAADPALLIFGRHVVRDHPVFDLLARVDLEDHLEDRRLRIGGEEAEVAGSPGGSAEAKDVMRQDAATHERRPKSLRRIFRLQGGSEEPMKGGDILAIVEADDFLGEVREGVWTEFLTGRGG